MLREIWKTVLTKEGQFDWGRLKKRVIENFELMIN